jgi:ribosomal protein S18 acetylase RimI-like enzyme
LKIIQGNHEQINTCLNIARKMPQYFTNKAISDMNQNLQEQSFYIAFEENEIIGFVSIYKKSNEVAEISWLAVRPICQRHGFGTALVNHAISELKNQSTKILMVKTLSEEANYTPYEQTRKFYEKLGFLHVDTIEHYPSWDPGNPCAIFVLIL